MGYSFWLTARVLLYAPSHRQDNTYHSLCYTSCGAPAGTSNSSMGPPWRIVLMTHCTTSERSYHWATSHSVKRGMIGRSVCVCVCVCMCVCMCVCVLKAQQVFHDWCNKSCGMCYPVCGMVYIKYPLLLIVKIGPCSGSSRFPLSLSERSFTICPTPYNKR